jgi:IS5 family transposase
VADSISWRRFARIPLGGRVPPPTTLMKITTRCGEGAVAGLNETLLAKAAGQKLLRTHKIRADTTVLPADVDYPTDSGLLAKAVAKMGRTVRRVQGAGGATRTRFRDRRRSAGRRVRAIASKLRLRGDESRAATRRLTGELAELAAKTMADAAAVLRNARRRLRHGGDAVGGRLRRTVDDLAELVERTATVVAQTRTRLSGDTPDGATRLVSLHDPDARPIRKGRLGKPVEFGYKAQVVDNPDGIVVDHTIEIGAPPDAPQLAPDRPGHRPHRQATAGGHRRPRLRPGRRRGRPTRPRRHQRRHPHARPNRQRHAANTSIDDPSAAWSSGAPDPKAASAHSSVDTDGTAANSTASTEPGSGADTESSPTTWSRSAH